MACDGSGAIEGLSHAGSGCPAPGPPRCPEGRAKPLGVPVPPEGRPRTKAPSLAALAGVGARGAGSRKRPAMSRGVPRRRLAPRETGPARQPGVFHVEHADGSRRTADWAARRVEPGGSEAGPAARRGCRQPRAACRRERWSVAPGRSPGRARARSGPRAGLREHQQGEAPGGTVAVSHLRCGRLPREPEAGASRSGARLLEEQWMIEAGAPQKQARRSTARTCGPAVRAVGLRDVERVLGGDMSADWPGRGSTVGPRPCELGGPRLLLADSLALGGGASSRTDWAFIESARVSRSPAHAVRRRRRDRVCCGSAAVVVAPASRCRDGSRPWPRASQAMVGGARHASRERMPVPDASRIANNILLICVSMYRQL